MIRPTTATEHFWSTLAHLAPQSNTVSQAAAFDKLLDQAIHHRDHTPQSEEDLQSVLDVLLLQRNVVSFQKVLELMGEESKSQHLLFALNTAIAYNDADFVHLISPHCTPEDLFKGFLQALVMQKSHLVAVLSKKVNLSAEDSMALVVAVEANANMDVIALLLNHCDPKAQKSEALRRAVSSNNTHLIDLLFDISDPHVVAAIVPKDSRFAGHQYFWKKYDAFQQSQILHQEVGATMARIPSPKKM